MENLRERRSNFENLLEEYRFFIPLKNSASQPNFTSDNGSGNLDSHLKVFLYAQWHSFFLAPSPNLINDHIYL